MHQASALVRSGGARRRLHGRSSFGEGAFVTGEGLEGLTPGDLLDAHDFGLPSVTLEDAGVFALLPNWWVPEATLYRATRVLHEAVHLGNLRTETFVVDEPGAFFNAYRFQGFVSQLTGLPYSVETVQMRAGGVGECAR